MTTNNAAMSIFGVDFTSVPSYRKPITCARSGFAIEGWIVDPATLEAYTTSAS
jgi:hypothetical protein